ncbi:MAG: tetratricopeptide repeat protein [Bryobacteraceae bacterium]
MRLGTVVAVLVLAAFPAPAAKAQANVAKAQRLYNRTEYRDALAVLKKIPRKTAAEWELEGRCRYMLGDFKPAIEALEKAVRLEPVDSDHYLWLGRAWGRRAETSVFFMAVKYAGHARQNFEKAVELAPGNMEAVNDLFSYYLSAPGFLGGGIDRAIHLSEIIQKNDPVEYQWALARIAIERKQYDLAEGQLKKAIDMAPRQISRIVDLAKFLAGQGRISESEAAFEQAASINPSDKKLLFTRAETYVKGRRNLETAKKLLEAYLQAPLTPDDPSREEARKLLERASGASD